MGEITPIDFIQKTLNIPQVPCYYQYDLFKIAIENITVENGLYLEFGLFAGNTAKQICEITKNKLLYGFDSFQGQEKDITPESIKGSNRWFGELPKYHDNVRIVVGRIQDSLPKFLEIHKEPISFLNIDVSSNGLKDGLTILSYQNRLKKGTVIVICHAIKLLWGVTYDSIYQAFIEWVKQFNVQFKYVGFGDVHLALILIEDIIVKNE